MKQVKLNLGCGDKIIPNWINVDNGLGAWLFKIPGFFLINKKIKLLNTAWSKEILIHDLRNKLPWEDESVDIVYSSHTLEHLFRSEGEELLHECYRVLKPSGVIRIVVPDLKMIVSRYVDGKIPAREFLDVLCVHYSRPSDKWIRQLLAPVMSFPHKCMYDTDALMQTMAGAGFEVVSKEGMDSEIDDIELIEDWGRTVGSVIVEGQKK